MRTSSIVIGKTYKHKNSGNYAKVLAVLRPNRDGNFNSYTVMRCGFTQSINDDYFFIKHFKNSDLEEIV